MLCRVDHGRQENKRRPVALPLPGQRRRTDYQSSQYHIEAPANRPRLVIFQEIVCVAAGFRVAARFQMKRRLVRTRRALRRFVRAKFTQRSLILQSKNGETADGERQSLAWRLGRSFARDLARTGPCGRGLRIFLQRGPANPAVSEERIVAVVPAPGAAYDRYGLHASPTIPICRAPVTLP